jgi:hypothetical protein
MSFGQPRGTPRLANPHSCYTIGARRSRMKRLISDTSQVCAAVVTLMVLGGCDKQDMTEPRSAEATAAPVPASEANPAQPESKPPASPAQVEDPPGSEAAPAAGPPPGAQAAPSPANQPPATPGHVQATAAQPAAAAAEGKPAAGAKAASGPAAGCRQSGGRIEIKPCCDPGDFPNLCEGEGRCACAPNISPKVRMCICPKGKCFNGNACVAR